VKLDLQAKATEEIWQKKIDQFWLCFTPWWFTLLEWLLIIGALSYLSEQTGHILLKNIVSFSYFGLFFYIQSVFFSMTIIGLPTRSRTMKRVIPLIVSGLMTSGSLVFINSIVPLLRK
jgi:hypothetical protein